MKIETKSILAATSFLLVALIAACGSVKAVSADAASPDGASTSTGGTSGTGSAAGTGGQTGGGGSMGPGTGGSTGTRNAAGSGGLPGTGGARTGGSTASGGSAAPGGGSAATGGSTASGGSAATGGSTGSGGSAARGGPTDGGNSSDTGSMAPAATAVNLRTAGTFAILSKSGISTVPPAAITGNLGVSPIAATAITGFSLIADPTNVFSTSSQVTGKVYAADYATPTPAMLTAAVGDMGLAFTDAAGRAPNVTELGAGNIGGMTLVPGVYKWGTGVLIGTNVTLNGSATAVWIFQIAQGLTMSSAANIYLTGGALASNVFWQVGGGVVLGTTAHLEGIVLTQTSVTLATRASVKGRLLAQTAVTLDTSTLVVP